MINMQPQRVIGTNNAPQILLINPWIDDFAAFDFWASPLGLLRLCAILRDNGFCVTYLDCLDRFHPGLPRVRTSLFGQGQYPKRNIIKPSKLADVPRKYSRYGLPEDLVSCSVKALTKPDLIMITSQMTYWYPGLFATIRLVRTLLPDVPIVLGGIYATLCYEHAVSMSGADYVLPGQDVRSVLALAGKLVGAAAASSVTPQPELDELDSYPYPAFDLQHKIAFVPILTGQGCPYECSYCASKILNPSFRRRSPGHVIDEIAYWNQKYAVKDFVFYDDALLVDATRHIMPILEGVIRLGLGLRFHTPNAVHINQITPELAKLMSRAGFRTLRLGLETASFGKARRHDHKVEFEDLDLAARSLREAGFAAESVGAYLLFGLPGQDIEEVVNSIVRVKKLGINPVLAYYTPIPHTKLWPAAVEASRYDLASDPIFHNNSIFPCQKSSFSWDQLNALKRLR